MGPRAWGGGGGVDGTILGESQGQGQGEGGGRS